MHEDDEMLIQGFRSGDHESFEELILKYRGKAISFARRYVDDDFIAEDIVQESFAALYVYRDRYKEQYSFKTYLFTIVKNKSIDYLRKKRDCSLDGIQTVGGVNPEEEVLRAEEWNFIRQKINYLKEDYRTVIHLLENEDFSYQEIARIMGKSLGQVKVLVYRARKKLKSLLEREV